MTTERVGLVGVGAMGLALLKLLRRCDVDVRAFDIAEASSNAARTHGAVIAGSAADAAGVEFIHVFVTSDLDAGRAIGETAGVLDGAEPGAIILLHSTVLPETARRLAELAASRKVGFVDAPLTAVPRKFEAGEGAFLVGASDEAFSRVRDRLLAVGKSATHFGPVGSGCAAKILKAFVNASERVVFSEALQVAHASGLDLRQFLDFERSEARPRCVADWEENFALGPDGASSKPSFHLFRKDVFLAERLAEHLGLSLPMTKGAASTARQWVDEWDKNPG